MPNLPLKIVYYNFDFCVVFLLKVKHMHFLILKRQKKSCKKILSRVATLHHVINKCVWIEIGTILKQNSPLCT